LIIAPPYHSLEIRRIKSSSVHRGFRSVVVQARPETLLFFPYLTSVVFFSMTAFIDFFMNNCFMASCVIVMLKAIRIKGC